MIALDAVRTGQATKKDWVETVKGALKAVARWDGDVLPAGPDPARAANVALMLKDVAAIWANYAGAARNKRYYVDFEQHITARNAWFELLKVETEIPSHDVEQDKALSVLYLLLRFSETNYFYRVQAPFKYEVLAP